MTRYFFNVRDGTVIKDEIGCMLTNWHEARNEAFRRASAILKEYPQYQDGTPWEMQVLDEAGEPVLTIGFQANRTGAVVPA